MNTTNLSNVCPPVGQLAKSGIFPLKSSTVKAFEVGRHQNGTSHTGGRTHAGTYAPDFKAEQLILLKDKDLITGLCSYLSDQLPEPFLFPHNSDYLYQLREHYNKRDFELFVLLVSLFAVYRDGAKYPLHTAEGDFLQAFRIMKKRRFHQLKQAVKPHWKTKVLDVVRHYFPSCSFDETDICKHLYLTIQQVEQTLCLLHCEKTIGSAKDRNGTKAYCLILKNQHYAS